MKMQLKRMGFIGIFLLCFSSIGFPETRYVTDVWKLTLRSGPSTENKILAMVESGQQVEMLERGDDWSRVRLTSGKEGYVLTRYLMSSPTHGIRLALLQKKHDALTQQADALLEENTKLNYENQQLRSSSEEAENSLTALRADYDELKAGSAEFISLKSKFKKVSTQLAEQSKRAAKLDEQLSKVEVNQYIKWFLAGSGVLLVGFIVGFSARRNRRRPSLL